VLLRPVKTGAHAGEVLGANEYAIATRAEMRQAAAELMAGQASEDAPVVDLVEAADRWRLNLRLRCSTRRATTRGGNSSESSRGSAPPRVAEIVALG